jgi:hypothetical protein
MDVFLSAAYSWLLALPWVFMARMRTEGSYLDPKKNKVTATTVDISRAKRERPGVSSRRGSPRLGSQGARSAVIQH